MKIKFIPQRRDVEFTYSVEGDILTIEINGEVDVFDFTGVPDGILDMSGMDEPITSLAYNPVTSAKKEEGVLYLDILRPHGTYATYEEKFPSTEYVEAEELTDFWMTNKVEVIEPEIVE